MYLVVSVVRVWVCVCRRMCMLDRHYFTSLLQQNQCRTFKRSTILKYLIGLPLFSYIKLSDSLLYDRLLCYYQHHYTICPTGIHIHDIYVCECIYCVFVYVCICVHVCTCVCMCTNLYIYIFIYIYMYIYLYTRTFIHIYIYVYTYVYIQSHVHLCMHIYMRTRYTSLYISLYICAHAYVCIPLYTHTLIYAHQAYLYIHQTYTCIFIHTRRTYICILGTCHEALLSQYKNFTSKNTNMYTIRIYTFINI